MRSGDALVVRTSLGTRPIVLTFGAEVLQGDELPDELQALQQELWEDAWLNAVSTAPKLKPGSARSGCDLD